MFPNISNKIENLYFLKALKSIRTQRLFLYRPLRFYKLMRYLTYHYGEWC